MLHGPCGSRNGPDEVFGRHSRDISLWFARYHTGRVARGGAFLLASSLDRRIAPSLGRGELATRRPIPGPPSANETTTVTVAESCISNAPVAFSDLPHSYLRATIGSTLVARRAGTYTASRATIISSRAKATKVSGSLGRTPYSKPVRTRVSPRATATPTPTPIRVRRSPSPTTIRN